MTYKKENKVLCFLVSPEKYETISRWLIDQMIYYRPERAHGQYLFRAIAKKDSNDEILLRLRFSIHYEYDVEENFF